MTWRARFLRRGILQARSAVEADYFACIASRRYSDQ